MFVLVRRTNIPIHTIIIFVCPDENKIRDGLITRIKIEVTINFKDKHVHCTLSKCSFLVIKCAAAPKRE